MNVKKGQVWRDNYQPTGAANPRFVKVLKDGATNTTIQRCNEDGSEIARSPQRTTATKRFNGKKDGFTLHRDESGAVVTPEAAAAAVAPAAPSTPAPAPATTTA